MVKRNNQEINAGSMADIAFLLLIFFLVTTTMSTDIGIVRKLPPMQDEPVNTTLNKRNVLNVWVNRTDKIMVKSELVALSDLKATVKEFILNPERKSDLPEIKSIYVPEIGNVKTSSQHVISLLNDRGTSYRTYIAVQNELAAAYNELRNELAIETWGIKYEDLNADRKKAVETVFPLRVSEAEETKLASLK